MRSPTPKPSPAPDTRDLRAVDIMQRDIVTVQASDPLHRVEQVLVDARISGVPVLDDEGQLLGIVSMHDLMRHHAETDELPADVDPHVFDDVVQETETVAYERDDEEPCAGDLMTVDVVCVRPAATLAEVAWTMVEAGVHRVLVHSGRRLVGIISSMDLMAAFAGAPATA